MNKFYRPRRSMLYVPGCNPRYINKARSLIVDSVILDLGNPILVEAKEASRKYVVEAVRQGGYAARAYDRSVVDGINTNLKDMQSFEYACRFGRDLGFDGKTLVHPIQLDYCNDAYTPKRAEVETAEEIIDALEQANAVGKGTVVVNGKLIELHNVEAAKRLLVLSEMIKKLEEESA